MISKYLNTTSGLMAQVNINDLMKKLNSIYNREEVLIIEVKRLKLEYEQLQEDKELLQNMIMHQSNKNDRMFKWIKDGKFIIDKHLKD